MSFAKLWRSSKDHTFAPRFNEGLIEGSQILPGQGQTALWSKMTASYHFFTAILLVNSVSLLILYSSYQNVKQLEANIYPQLPPQVQMSETWNYKGCREVIQTAMIQFNIRSINRVLKCHVTNI